MGWVANVSLATRDTLGACLYAYRKRKLSIVDHVGFNVEISTKTAGLQMIYTEHFT